MASSSDEKSKNLDNAQVDASTKIDKGEISHSVAGATTTDAASLQVKSSDPVDKSAAAYQGNGMAFRAKLIGQCQINQSRGDPVCEVAMSLLKMKQLASRQHKKRISIQLQWDAVRVLEDKTNEEIHSHTLSKISYVWKDVSDPRAFGLIVCSPDESEKKEEFSFMFFAYKTEKAAIAVMLAMKELFTLRQKETDNQQNEKKEEDKETESDVDKVEPVPEESLIVLDVENVEESLVETKKVEETNQIVDIARDPWSGEVKPSAAVTSKTSEIDLLQSVFLSSSPALPVVPPAPYTPIQMSSQWVNLIPQLSQVSQQQKTLHPMSFTSPYSSMTSPPATYSIDPSGFNSMLPTAPLTNQQTLLASRGPFLQPSQQQLSTGTFPFSTRPVTSSVAMPFYNGGGATFSSGLSATQPALSSGATTPFPQTNPFSNAMAQPKPLNPTNPFQNPANSLIMKPSTNKDTKLDDLFSDLLSSDLGCGLPIRENDQNKKGTQNDVLSGSVNRAPTNNPPPQPNVDWSLFEKTGNLLD